MSGTVLFISPDYASHYYPMSAVASVLGERGHRVIMATGPALRQRVVEDGIEHRTLVLGPGSNSGVMRSGDQDPEERKQLEAFFEATKQGLVPALRHQAESRLRDLLFRPQRVASEIARIISQARPDAIVVDHLAFAATAALRGLRREFVSFHPGHPSAISVDWPYGYPPRLPTRVRVDDDGLDGLRKLTQRVVNEFTSAYNEAVAALDPGFVPLSDAFAAVSPSRTLVNYPAALGISYPLPTSVRFIGSSVRNSTLTPELTEAFRRPTSRPRIYVSLGSFFSSRADLLRKIVTAFRREPVELVLARGATPASELGRIPHHWTIAEHLPQPAVIARSHLVVTHGGNNTVTEALTAGVPVLAGPLSTDQFAAAADLETAGLAGVFDPNFDDADVIADLAHDVLRGSAGAAEMMGESLRSNPGQTIAAHAIEEAMRHSSESDHQFRPERATRLA
jgi:zeaxanthin glucosyltransferase